MEKSRTLGILAAIVLTLASIEASAFDLKKRSAQPIDFQSLVGDGRWTLVMLWAIDCIPCEAQKPMIDDFHVSHVDADARVVGVALDGISEISGINEVIARTPTRFPHFVADARGFYSEFKARTGTDFRATPTYLLYDRDGNFAGAHVGPIQRHALEQVISGNKT